MRTMMLSAMSLILKLSEVSKVPSGMTATRISEAQIPPLMKASIFAAVASTFSRADAPSTERLLCSWFHLRPKQTTTHTAV